VVRDFVDGILNEDPGAMVMVTGDLNDFQFGEPGEGSDHPVAILEGGTGEVPLTNLLNLEKEAETFTFVFDGNSQVLDHTLVSPALLEHFVAVDILHFNAGFPSDLGEDPTTTLRASDHDPLESRFKLEHEDKGRGKASPEPDEAAVENANEVEEDPAEPQADDAAAEDEATAEEATEGEADDADDGAADESAVEDEAGEDPTEAEQDATDEVSDDSQVEEEESPAEDEAPPETDNDDKPGQGGGQGKDKGNN
jgi:hypothetical protein